MTDTCWNISQETNDLTATSNGLLATVTGLEAKIVELRSRLRTLLSESEDDVTGLDLALMYGDAPIYAKQEEIERAAKTVDGVVAVKVTDIQAQREKRTLIFYMTVVFDEGTVEMTVDTGE